MNWESAGDFFAMGGYALYVWGSFGVCALAMALEPMRVANHRRQVLARLRRQWQADQLNKDPS